MNATRRYLLPVLACLLLPGLLDAHPVPRNQYDRTIVVRFLPAEKPGDVLVRIDFRLEVDPQTVVLKDMRPFHDEVLGKTGKPLDYFKEFTRIYGDIFARNFFNRFNGKDIDLACVRRSQTFEDEEGKPLDHLRCDFRFQAILTPIDGENQFLLKDLNYQDHPGKLELTFLNESGIQLTRSAIPDPKLHELPFEERGPDEEQALRTVRLRFLSKDAMAKADAPAPAARADARADARTDAPAASQSGEGHFSLLRMFVDTEYGLLLMLLIAAAVGAVHALTPGHGKTMVAAYLVGERGTVWHAVFLGLVTTLTHTGIVLLLAASLLFLPDQMSEGMQRNIQTGLGLVMGLAITCLGMFLFLQRLAGRADHFHIGGGHHHHHHGHHSHGHHGHGHHGHHHHGAHQHGHSHDGSAAEEKSRRFGWWGLTVLGITGGLIPCWDAIALLVLAVGMNLFWLALPVLLAFSAGLASVLVVIGVAVVKFRNLLGDRWGEGRLVRALPIISAVMVTLMGFWICYEAVNVPSP